MSAATYRIPDEPVGPPTSNLVVSPTFPLLGFMLAGPWLGWPWLVLNAFAMKSPSRKQELALAGVGLVGSGLLILGLAALVGTRTIPKSAAPYGHLVITVFQLGVAYGIHLLQSRTFEIYQHYGGPVRNGLMVLVIGSVVRARVAQALPPLLAMVLT